jgi:uncharacterized coiled-coil DUF342 family protein
MAEKLQDEMLDEVSGGRLSELAQKTDLLAQKNDLLAQQNDMMAQKTDMLEQKTDMLDQKVDILMQKTDLLNKKVVTQDKGLFGNIPFLRNLFKSKNIL